VIITTTFTTATTAATTTASMIAYLRACFYNSNSVLSDYEYVQQCLNLDHDMRFTIVDIDSVHKPFQRTVSHLTTTTTATTAITTTTTTTASTTTHCQIIRVVYGLSASDKSACVQIAMRAVIGWTPIVRHLLFHTPILYKIMSTYRLRGEGLVWLNRVVVCLLAANRGSSCLLTWAMDGRIVRCGIIRSCQSAATSEIVKRFWS